MKQMTFILLMAILVTNAWATTVPFVGKWMLDVQRSKYPQGDCTKSMVIQM
jgi:hypothetical protein